jgi:hypothetical protein
VKCYKQSRADRDTYQNLLDGDLYTRSRPSQACPFSTACSATERQRGSLHLPGGDARKVGIRDTGESAAELGPRGTVLHGVDFYFP